MSAASKLTGEAALKQAEALLSSAGARARLTRGRIVVTLEPADLVETAARLRDDEKLSFTYLSFVSGVDYPDRMEAVYILRSLEHQQLLELRVRLDRNRPSLPTVSGIWSTAAWHEREAYDLLGIVFEGHPDLRRILTRGEDGVFPLRKDARPHRVQRDEWSFAGIGAAKRLPGEEDRSERS